MIKVKGRRSSSPFVSALIQLVDRGGGNAVITSGTIIGIAGGIFAKRAISGHSMLPIVMAGNRLANCVCFIYIRLGIMFNSSPTVTTLSIVFRFTMLSSASGCVGCGFFNNGIGQKDVPAACIDPE